MYVDLVLIALVSGTFCSFYSMTTDKYCDVVD